MVLTVILDALFVVTVGWFWLHCARPELEHHAASWLARGMVLGVTCLAMVVYGLDAVIRLVEPDLRGAWGWATTFAGALWIVVVAIGWWQSYRTLVRITGRK